MPAKRGYRRRKPAYKKRRAAKRASRANPTVHNFARSTRDTCLTNGNFGQVAWVNAPINWEIGNPTPDDNGLFQFGGSMRFQLADVINTIDFTALFDRYKLNKVVVSIMPLMNTGHAIISSGTGNTQSSILPTLVTAIDYDDSVVPTLADELLERSNCKSYRMGDKVINITIKNPKMLLAVQEGDPGAVTTVNAVTKSASYLDCAQDEINHYGLKFYVRDFALPNNPGTPPLVNSLIRIRCKYYFSFKEAK